MCSSCCLFICTGRCCSYMCECECECMCECMHTLYAGLFGVRPDLFGVSLIAMSFPIYMYVYMCMSVYIYSLQGSFTCVHGSLKCTSVFWCVTHMYVCALQYADTLCGTLWGVHRPLGSAPHGDVYVYACVHMCECMLTLYARLVECPSL